jgi:hypothetical protein
MRRIQNWMADFPVGDTKACLRSIKDISETHNAWLKDSWTGGTAGDLEKAWDRCLQCYVKACNRLMRGIADIDPVQINAIDYWLERGDAALEEVDAELAAIENMIGSPPTEDGSI